MMDRNELDLHSTVGQLTYEQEDKSKQTVFTDTFNLSKGQESLWTAYKLFPDSTAYNVPMAYRLNPNFNLEAFQHALQMVIMKHPSLRTIFKSENETTVKQHILHSLEVPIYKIDIKEDGEDVLIKGLQKAANKPFSLEEGPLLAVTILFQEEKPVAILINIHHIIFDGISMQIFMKDLQYYYSQWKNNKQIPEIIETKVSFSDFVAWEENMLQSANAESAKEFWANKVQDNITSINLPFKSNEKNAEKFKGAHYSIDLDKNLVDLLKKFSYLHYHSLYTIMLSAYTLLLKKYTDEKIVIGVPMGNRLDVNFEEVIGFLMNMTLLESKVKKEDTFHSLIKRNENHLFDAMEHSSYPLHQVSKDTNKSMLFNTAFYYQNWVQEIESINNKNDSIFQEPILAIHQKGEFDLTLEIIEMKESISVYFKYNPTLYDSFIIEQLANHYIQLLKRVLVRPNQEVSSISVLTDDEMVNILSDCNNTTFDYGTAQYTHELFEEVAMKEPESMAVSTGKSTMSYRELNDYSNQLANYLTRHGVNHGDLVGIYLRRSPYLLASLLAIHKAGAAYVPLDPIYPKDRIDYMMEHSEIRYIITESKLVGDLNLAGITQISIDLNDKNIARESTIIRHRHQTELEDTAYVMYTSGSTGKPKGVEVLHKGLSNFLCYMKETLTITNKDKFFSLTTICFDIVALELFLPIISGASVEIGTDDEIRDGLAIKKIIEEKGVNVLQGTPSNWRMIRGSGWLPEREFKLLVGGEKVDSDTKEYLTQNGSKVWNVYGPTETTIWSTIKPLTLEGSISIGRPMGNTQVYILDSALQPVPIGVAGDLYIGGDGLARGYYKNPEITKKSFIACPFSQGRIMYKTGDLARYLPNGEIEYIGRDDQQIKLRGFRLELGEIEAVLKTNNNVNEAVIVLRENRYKVKQLIGFIQQNSYKGEEFHKELIQEISEKLPDYMIPSALITLNDFPLTLNQKIDRKVLRDEKEEFIRNKYGVEHHTKSVENESTVKPEISKTIKTSLIELIAATRGIDKFEIDVSVNIGEYGFDSISYTKLAREISEQYEIDIKPNIFYRYSTIELLTEYLLANFQEELSTVVSPSTTVQTEVKIEENQRRNDTVKNKPIADDSVAIVGMSGKMPQSKDLDEFWDALLNGKDLIEEIPPERWDWRAYEGDPMEKGNNGSSKWGGFIPDVDKFDPFFFGISPYEAKSMDPQQRLILESVWKTIENSGHRPSELSGTKTGVFIGSSGSDFLGSVGDEIGNYTLTGIAKSVLANRVSYLLNLMGPSEPVDTACSSGLIAMHRAVEAIRNGECEQAIAGAVNVMITPFASIAASKVGMLSEDGRCKAFDASANGYVRGEGVATILLKPLSKAIVDNDFIYGIVKGSAVNHGGKANSFTAPNPNAQTDLLVKAYQKAKVNPSNVSYIEAHGTGTELGDPIEIDGLKNAFNQLYEEWGIEIPSESHCGIASVKSNIGHLEAASGIAGVIKTLLCMQHEVLPSNIHLKEKNPYIDLKNSPFYLVEKKKDWEPLKDQEHNALPRIAGVSSFGFGGSNSHIVLEEYKHEIKNTDEEEFYIIPISAQSEEQLKEAALNLRDFLLKAKPVKQKAVYSLKNIAFTLQIGREAMRSRISFVVSSEAELIEKLNAFIANTNNRAFYIYTRKKRNSHPDLLDKDNVKSMLDEENLEVVAYQWAIGNSIEWNELYKKDMTPFQRIPLPTYPFNKEFYPIHPHKEAEMKSVSNEDSAPEEHPMLNKYVWLPNNLCSVSLSGEAYYIKDHIVNDKLVMPGAAYLELALATANSRYPNNTLNTIKNIVWSRPLIMDDNREEQITIQLEEVEQSNLSYSFESKEETLSNGKIAFQQFQGDMPPVRIAEIKERCTNKRTKTECYNLFTANDFKYGPSFQVIQAIQYSSNESLAHIAMPSGKESTIKNYTLHPSLLDGALQSIILLLGNKNDQAQVLPFAIDEIQIHRPLELECYVYGVLKRETGKVQKYDLSITDLSGNVLVYIKGYSLRMVKESIPDKQNAVHFYQPCWIESGVPLMQERNFRSERIFIFANDPSRYKEWANIENIILVKEGAHFRKEDENLYLINPLNDQDYELLLQDIKIESSNDINHIAILWPLHSNDRTVEDKYNYSAESLFRFIKTIINQKIKKVTISYVYDTESNSIRSIFDKAIGGLSNVLAIEQPNITLKTIGIDKSMQSTSQILTVLQNERDQDLREVKYIQGRRYIQSIVTMKPTQMELDNDSIYCNDGVYIITGGAGTIGLFLAENITKQVRNPHLYLMGRSVLIKEVMDRLEDLKSKGAIVHYLQVDVTNRDEVYHALNNIKKQHNHINGIFHVAGMIKDSYILKKSVEDFREVIKPKVFGIINLEKSLEDFEVDFLILFSSVSSITGNIGQSDYAFANRFLDEFSVWRKNNKDKKGKTISINWPLWKDGGMKVDDTVVEKMEKNWGIVPISNELAWQSIDVAIKQNMNQLIPLEGDGMKIDEVLQVKTEGVPGDTAKGNSEVVSSEYSEEMLLDLTIEYLKEIISTATEVPNYKIDEEEPFEVYGIDSVMILKLNTELESMFGDLSKTLFFEYENTFELAGYFIENHRTQLIEQLDLKVEKEESPLQMDQTNRVVEPISEENSTTDEEESISNKEAIEDIHQEIQIDTDFTTPTNDPFLDDIAIVGLDGKYPEAENLYEFWENLKEGKNCITEIPSDRWDYRKHYTEQKGERGKTYSKWGGFLKDIDKFDPLFFNISPLEAQMLDPQERLFIQTVWHTLEDAGYTRKKLTGKNVGVYVGAMWGQYQLYGGEIEEGVVVTPTSSYASIANRVSYFFNFNGPSLTLDTMCSSSLTTIHLACESIRNGEIDMAIAGGVNLTVHPNKHVFLSQTKFASSDGLCRSFGEGGDGYVPGEGVGAVLLKPLKKAIEDNDRIYSVIKGSVLNHGGKTNGYTVPNPNAQENLIEKALTKTGIDPRTISYIEAHGTGTELGDPIEITGISKAFDKYTNGKQYCSIGSVKSNIGHCESAAGIAGITKLVLQLKHKKLVPSIHSDSLNQNINFEKTPFYVQQKLEDWNQPIIIENGREKRVPRRAGISSFGAGGANAHIILEEYEPSNQENDTIDSSQQLLILSAKNKEQLREYARNMVQFLSDGKSEVTTLPGGEGQESVSVSRIGKGILEELSKILSVSSKDLDIHTSFDEYGMDYLGLNSLFQKVKEKYHIEVAAKLEDNVQSIIEKIQPASNVTSDSSTNSFADIAYTVQTGREEMEERLAIVASTPEEAVEKLLEYCNGVEKSTSFYQNNIEQSAGNTDFLFTGKEGKRFVKELIKNKQLDKLAHLWVSGISISWHLLHEGLPKKIVTAPKYPFAKERCWVTDEFPLMEQSAKIHPLVNEVDVGLSLQGGVVYKTILSARMLEQITDPNLSKVFITEVIKVVLDEVSEKAVVQQLEFTSLDLSELTEGTLYTHLENKDGLFQIQLRIDSHSNEEQWIAKGIAQMDEHIKNNEVLSITDLLQNSNTGITNIISKEGLTIESKNTSEEMVIQWENSSRNSEYFYDQILVPEILKMIEDTFEVQGDHGIRVINEITTIHKSESRGIVYVQKSEEESFNIYFINANDEIGAVWKGCSYKNSNAILLDRFFYQPTWKEVIQPNTIENQHDKKILFIEHDSNEELVIQLKEHHINDQIYTFKLSDKNQKLGPEYWEMDGSMEEVTQLLNMIPDVDTVYFLTGLSDPITIDDNVMEDFINIQEQGVILLYRIVMAMESVMPNNEVDVKVVTNNVQVLSDDEVNNPYSASLIGFSKSLAKEYKNINVSSIDISLKDSPEENAVIIVQEEATSRVKEIAIRGNKCYERVLLPEKLPDQEESAYKVNGVYLIAGGMGNVGHKLSQYLAEQFQAKLVITGRTVLNDTIREKIKVIEEKGGEVLYIQADLTDLEGMNDAVHQAIKHYGKINGVIHSAMNFSYEVIKDMNEEKLIEELGSKSKGSLVLYHAIKDLPLDFLVFFSSGEAFTGNVGWSSYAAGCTFKDAYATHVSSLVDYPVQIINWGFWNNDQDEFMGMLQSKGIHPIEMNLGMQALERILANKSKQLMALNVEDNVLALMGVDLPEHSLSNKHNFDKTVDHQKESIIHSPDSVENFPEMDEESLQLNVEEFVKQTISHVLKMNVDKIENNKDFSFYGVDSLIVTDIHQEFENELGEKLQVTLLLENTTVDDVTEYLIDNHRDVLLRKFGEVPNDIKEQKTMVKQIHQNKPEQSSVSSDHIRVVGAGTSEGFFNNHDIEVLSVTEQSKVSEMLYEYGDKFTDGTLKGLTEQVLNKDELVYQPKSMYHMMVNTSYNKKIEVFTIGEGIPILLVPAIGLTAPIWTNQLREWSDKYQLIVIHHPGYGISETPKQITEEIVSNIFKEVLGSLGIVRKIHIVASCFGGVVAKYFAKEYPDLVASLTLSGTFYKNFGLPDIKVEDLTIDQMVEGASLISEGVNRDFDVVLEHTDLKHHPQIEEARELLNKSQCVDPLVVMRYVTQILTVSGGSWLADIKAPTLCIAGNNDTIVSSSIPLEISELIPGGIYTEIEGSGHYPYLTHTESFNQQVLPFIEKQESLILV